MAQFILYTNAAGEPCAVNVAYVKKFFVGDVVLSTIEQYTLFMAIDQDGSHAMLRGDPQMLRRALYDMIWILAQGASVRIHSDGKVEPYDFESD